MKADEPNSDGQWIRSALDRFEGPLTLYANRITGSIEQARDVVQETFIRLCSQKRSKVEPYLAEWLYRVCRNRALDVRKKEKRMTPLADAQTEIQKSQEPSPLESLEQKESTTEALRALSALPENQQEVIRLKFQHELSYKEISQVTQLSVSNVGYLIHVGLRSIREKMNASANQS